MSTDKSQIAHFLNLCDRVEVLSDIVHDEDHKMDFKTFDPLTESYYPCLEQFFGDIRKESDVVGIDAAFEEDAATFTARYADNSTKIFSYSKPQDGVM